MAVALTANAAVLGAEPAETELTATEVVSAHGAASLNAALLTYLHQLHASESGCGCGRRTLMTVALAAEAAVGWTGPAVAEPAAAAAVTANSAADLEATGRHRLGLRGCRQVDKGKRRQHQDLCG